MASWLFRALVAVRALLFWLGILRVHRAPVPVISIGNLTAGGTGKTPLTIALAERLVARGERVCVLARGYGAARPGELNDELELVRARVPGVSVLAGADRVALAHRAAAEGATVCLLDDGFQHRRLGRDLDVLVVDATDPWGEGFVLPRGLLREPVAAARRASAVVISRVEQAPEGRVDAIRARLAREGIAAPVATMSFEARVLRPLGASPALALADLAGRGVVAVSGIGNPAAFAATLARAGATVRASHAFPDHHAFSLGDLDELSLAIQHELGANGRPDESDVVVVTEKDAVKIEPLLERDPRSFTRPIYALRVDARLAHADALLAAIDRALSRDPEHEAARDPHPHPTVGASP